MSWRFLLIFLVCCLGPSCTQMVFESKGTIPVFLTHRELHERPVKVEGTKEFYLWGLISPDKTVYVDEELYDAGLVSAANVYFYQTQSWAHYWASILSLGLYIPKGYQITSMGVGVEE